MWASIEQFVMSWSGTTFYIVLAILAVCLLYCIMSFVKKAYGTKSNNKIRWGLVIFAIVLAVLIAIIAAARWA